MDYFKCFNSFRATAKKINDKELRLKYLEAIFQYAFEDIEPEDSIISAIFEQTKFVIDRSKKISESASERGKKGGLAKASKSKQVVAKAKTELALPTEEYSFIKDFLSLTTSGSTMMQKDKTYTEKQAKEVDMLIKDGYDLETIKTVLRFIAQDSFWSQNIKSIGKLRKKNPDGIPYMLVMIDKIKQWKPAVVNLDKL